ERETRAVDEGGFRWSPVFLCAVVLAALAVKLIYVEALLPARNHGRAPAAKGRELAALVPAGETLYLFRMKDDGLMYYYSRERAAQRHDENMRRLASPAM